VDETDATKAVRLLAARLPFWTIWYGQHTGHFWALPKNPYLASAPHIESSTADELEQKAWKIERAFLAQPVRRRPARPVLRAR
jgi:hypothetical protein